MFRSVVGVVVALATLLGPLAGAAGDPGPDGQRLVVLEQGLDGRLQVRTIEPGTVIGASDDHRILAIEPEGIVYALSDPRRDDQWSLDVTGAESAWPMSDGTGTVLAVIDTGVRASHEDLQGRLLPTIDLLDGRVDGDEADHFHGTHVAGIAAANAGNGLGISGVAPGVQILPVRALGANGTGTTGTVAEGILRAVEEGADVINLSLGAPAPSSVINTAIDYAVQQDIVVVAASGNSALHGNPQIWPAALDGVLAVGSIDASGNRSSFSSYGSYIDVVAPGSQVLSSQHDSDDDYGSASGTSMAAPHVAAAAAIVRSIDPGLSEAEVRDVLVDTAADLGPIGFDVETGHGLLDVEAAAIAALGDGGAPSTGVSYRLVTDSGRVLEAGGRTPFGGQLDDVRLAKPVVAAALTPSGEGYWMVAGDGGIFAFGDATFHGSMGGTPLNEPINGMAATASGEGYWMVASDGGIFAFGDATFHGSMGGAPLNRPIVGMAATASGEGYWMVASDGGIFAFGDATFHGS
ncbi:MAG: S8 family serine peptidase, partial [Actinomycetota bacterium]